MTESTTCIGYAVAASRRDSFLPKYRDKITDADALGIAVSKWADFEGDKIAEVMFSALEDANYHSIRAEFVELWNEQNGTHFT